MWFKKKKIEYKVKRDELLDFAMMLLGCLFMAVAFNAFLLPNSIVVGFSGLSVIINNLFGIKPSVFMIITYPILALLSLKFLGFESTRRTIIGSITYPIMVELTTHIVSYIDLSSVESMTIILCGAILNGFGSGLIYRFNYNAGGSDVLNQLLSKFIKRPIGTCVLITNGVIISLGFLVFGVRTVIYSVLVTYIMSIVIDKVMIGISESKTFQIITKDETEVKKFLLTKLSHGVTVLQAKGGYTGDNIKIIMCIIPTSEYITVKEGVLAIDPNALIMVSDVYEVVGEV